MEICTGAESVYEVLTDDKGLRPPFLGPVSRSRRGIMGFTCREVCRAGV